MERLELPQEIVDKMNNLERINWDAFKELVEAKQIKPLIKFKAPKTIWWDEDYLCFVFFNPYKKKLWCCAVWVDRINDDGNLIPLEKSLALKE
jgi:hypothetical protein